VVAAPAGCTGAHVLLLQLVRLLRCLLRHVLLTELI
jgi:hypothetical protein